MICCPDTGHPAPTRRFRELGARIVRPSKRHVPTRHASRKRPIARRAFGGVVDQAASSATNFVILLAALRSLSIGDLGTFTFAYALALLAVTVVRALVLEPLSIRYTTADPSTLRMAVTDAAGASLSIGFCMLLLAAVVSPLVGHGLGTTVLTFGAILPMLLLQDVWRIYHFACGRPWSAVLDDAVCLVAALALVSWLLNSERQPGVVSLLACWGIATSTGAVVGIAQARVVPQPLRAWDWLRRHGDLGLPLAGERSAESTAAQLSLLLVAALVGSVALGELGAARALMSPITTLTTSVVLFGLPEAVRLRQRAMLLTRLTAGMSAVTATAVLIYAGILYEAPDRMGSLLAGDNWQPAKALLIPVAVWTAASGARSGPSVALRALQRGRLLTLLSVVTGIVVLGVTVVGAQTYGAQGAAWGFALTYLLAIATYWTVFLRARDAYAAHQAFHEHARDEISLRNDENGHRMHP